MRFPLRILHVIGRMDIGGAETLIMNLHRKVDKSVIQFDFVENTFDHCAYDDEIESLGGIIHRCPHFNGNNYFQYKQWWTEFFKKHPEYRMVHGHLGSTAAIYLKIAKQAGCFTIAHSHNTNDYHSIKGILYSVLSYKTRNIADCFFACSDQAGKDRFGSRVEFKVINNAIDTAAFKYDESVRRSVRKEFDIEEDVFLLGHVGRMMKQKNHHYLIKVFSQIKKRNPSLGIKLMLVGDGPLRKEIEAQVRSLSLTENVIFTGVRPDVDQLLQAMDVFVMPSLYEGLPVSIVEAQTAGLPCVISDGIPEDCMITDLVHQISLSSGPDKWADYILSLCGYNRTDKSEEVAAAGFDIANNASFMQQFYMNHYYSE